MIEKKANNPCCDLGGGYGDVYICKESQHHTLKIINFLLHSGIIDMAQLKEKDALIQD
jgi:hypothetical protein